MKKMLACLTAAVCGAAMLVSACGTADEGYTVYAPDGAPALSLLSAIAEDDDTFAYRVVDSSTIAAQVTGENPAADFCVLPLNAASLLLGTGETYKMLGTVTHGNLFFLTTGENPVLTAENLESALVGKTVGVVQLTNVPGLTLQVVLNDNGIPYQTIESVGAEKDENKVNLVSMGTDATNVTPAYGCDYYLCPEPAATTKVKGTASSANPFALAGDLQELYGGEDGFPQAVLVAKKSVIEKDAKAVKKLISYFEKSETYLKTVEAQTVLDLLEDKRTEGLAPSFNANNLNAQVIANCSVRFTAAADCKEEVNAFLEKLIAVNPSFVKMVSDGFYYAG